MKKIKNPIKTTGKDIKSLALLANKILTNETPYSITKNLIFKKLFQKKINMFDADVIRSRLIVIDATYSTNFNKRYYGFDDLIKHFKEFGKTDSELSNSFKEFLNETSNKLLDNEKLFGISKKGDVKGHGLSLISKYGYYLTKYKFPIYDSLAKEFLWKVNQNFDKNSIKKKDLSDCKKYFKIVQEVNDKLMIKDFDKLDNLLWLLGQINKGLLSQ
ncbi:MAG: hypothetical protein IPJ45_09095 [Ignavibacteria bacterium]|nr:hypothetical protein [Ignavibacteria bacterium]